MSSAIGVIGLAAAWHYRHGSAWHMETLIAKYWDLAVANMFQ